MPACEIRPEDKRAFIGAVGEELVKRHGKKKYYKPDDIDQGDTIPHEEVKRRLASWLTE